MAILVEINKARVGFHDREFIEPLKLSSGTITCLCEVQVEVDILCNGAPSTGKGSIYLSDLWAWPGEEFTHAEKEVRCKNFCNWIASRLSELCGKGHPMSCGLRLHENLENIHDGEHVLLPPLAREMCASPFDAAIHDATGLAMNASAFEIYSQDQDIEFTATHFPERPGTAAFRKVLRPPSKTLQGWHILSSAETMQESVARAYENKGFKAFKIKIMGKDIDEDVEHTKSAFQATQMAGIDGAVFCADANQAYPDSDSVLEYLKKLQKDYPGAYATLAYLEQPTHWNLAENPHDWHAVAKLKPVLVDEGLCRFDDLALAKEQGWSGFALKTCKGHSFALFTAAWAKQNGMCVSLQDLTNPGYSAIHSALFAAHVPTINGVEINSPQFTPEANREYLPKLSGLFEVENGTHDLSCLDARGLGSRS